MIVVFFAVLALTLPSILGCARHIPGALRPNATDARIVWNYDVRATGPLADTLTIIADFAPTTSDSFETDEDAAAFVHDVQVQTADGFRPAIRDGRGWTVTCRAVGCRVRYVFALGEAAAATADVDTAMTAGDVVIAPPSTWLLRPVRPAEQGRFRFRVQTQPSVRFATGILPAPGAPQGTFEAATSEIEAASFSAFGPFRLDSIRSGGAQIDVAIAPRGLAIDADGVRAWIESAANAIANYYRVFAVARTLVIVVPSGRGKVEGLTLGDGGPAIVLRAGPGFTSAAARDDWVATHELLHVTLPSLSRNHSWLSEGIATYVEPIVRARAGIVTQERYWRDLVDGLPQGLPAADDEGLERTHTWGRTYWGGALFCLVADIRIREMSHGKRSFDDALRAIASTGANVQSHWEVDHFLQVGDEGTGTAVLAGLYREMALVPGTVDLPALWSRLGVRVQGEQVSFDDGAPLAGLRRAITDPNANN